MFEGIVPLPLQEVHSQVLLLYMGNFQNHPFISRYIKGIFDQRSSLNKHVKIWDINNLISCYEKLTPKYVLPFRGLIKRLANLRARRKQALKTIDIIDDVMKMRKLYWLLMKLSNTQILKIL